MEQKIIDRIKKMFALANCEGAAPGEAENAMRMANRLMEKHALSSLDLHTSDSITIKFEDGSNFNWVRQLYNAIAPVYSCGFFIQGKEQSLLVGTESDTITASIVANGLISNIKRASKGKGVTFANGAVLEISKQCRELIANRRLVAEKVPGTELSLVDVYDTKADLVRSFMDANLSLGKGRRSNMKGNEAGRAYGATLNPHANLSNRRALN